MRIVFGKNGVAWLAKGFALFRTSPALWLVLVFGYWLLIALVNSIPIAGPVIATVSLPAFSMSFMEICDDLEHGRGVVPLALFAGFRKRLPTLVTLGGLYLVAIALVLWISSLADSGTLMNWILWGRSPPAEAIRDGRLSLALMLAGLAAAPVLSAFWFAPVLAAWQSMGASKSLFYSFFATWRNWRAFIVYGALLALLGVAMSVAVAVISLLFRGHPEGARAAMMFATIAILPTVFGSFYASYRDIFPQQNGAVVAAA